MAERFGHNETRGANPAAVTLCLSASPRTGPARRRGCAPCAALPHPPPSALSRRRGRPRPRGRCPIPALCQSKSAGASALRQVQRAQLNPGLSRFACSRQRGGPGRSRLRQYTTPDWKSTAFFVGRPGTMIEGRRAPRAGQEAAGALTAEKRGTGSPVPR